VQVLEDSGADEQSLNKGQEEVLACPICFKNLTCRNDFDTHMETHPDTTLRYKHMHQYSTCIVVKRHEFISGLKQRNV